MVQWVELSSYIDYNSGIKLMEEKVNSVINNNSEETVFLLEHPDIYTAGTSSLSSELLNSYNIPVYNTSRGGKFTYHGPGQLVVYPIINLSLPNRTKDIHIYLDNLSKTVINVLARLNISAFTIPNNVGVWVKTEAEVKKIAAIGIRIRKWVTYHGIAINISTDLTKFHGIKPCGLDSLTPTSLQELGINLSITEAKRLVRTEFTKIFDSI